MKDTVKTPKILRHISVDCVIFGYEEGALKVLLRKESIEHDGKITAEWKLPGNHVWYDETVEQTATRILREQTGVSNIFLKQFHVFSSIDRLHRREFDFKWIKAKGIGEWRVITAGFYAAVNIGDVDKESLSPQAEWKEIDEIGELIFDHREILDTALEKLKGDLTIEPVIFELLPAKFTLGDMQKLYEILTGQPVDKRNFRRKITAKDFIMPLAERQENVAHRAASFYAFNRKLFEKQRQETLMF